jgi:hypothetical protein
MIGIDSWWQLVLVIGAAIVAMLAFAAATQRWFLTRSRWWESLALLLVTFTLLRPGFWLDLALPRYAMQPGQTILEKAAAAPVDTGLRVRIEGTTLEGKDVKKTVLLPLGAAAPGPQRLAASGLRVMSLPSGTQVMSVALKSAADKAGFEQGFMVTGIETERPRLAKEWLFVPALLLLAAVAALQRRRPAMAERGAPADRCRRPDHPSLGAAVARSSGHGDLGPPRGASAALSETCPHASAPSSAGERDPTAVASRHAIAASMALPCGRHR